MIEASAELAITGPGFTVRVHGDGPVLTADLRGNIGAAGRVLRDVPGFVRNVREISQALRAMGLRIDVRVAGRGIAKLG